MPDVPTNDLPSIAPQVVSGSGFTANVSPDAFGAGIGRAAQQFGGELAQYAEREARYHDNEVVQNAIFDVQSGRMDLHDSLMKTDISDPAKLHDATDKARADFQTKLDAAEASLTSDRQRSAFASHARVEKYNFERGVQSYELQQGNKIAESKLVNGIKLKQVDAARDYDAQTVDPATGKPVNVVAQSIASQKQMIQETGDYLHWTPEKVQIEQAKAANATHASVLASMLTPGKDAGRAADYYEANKDELFPQEQEHLGKAVNTAMVRQKAGAAVGSIVWDNGRMRSPEQIDAELIRYESSPNADPQVAEEVRRRVKSAMDTHDDMMKKQESSVYSQVFAYGEKSNFDPSAIPPVMWEQLSPEHKKTFMEMETKGRNVKTDPSTYLKVQQMMADPTRREEAQNVNLLDYADKLSMGDMKELAKDQAAIRNGTDDQVTARNAVIKEVADHTLLQTGKDPNASSSKNIDAAKFNDQFNYELRSAIKANEALTGKRADRDTIQKIADDLIKPVAGTGGFMSDDKRTFQVPEALRSAKPLTAITPEENAAWNKILSSPHDPAFDNSVAKLQRWSAGVTEDGTPNRNLPAIADKLIAQSVPAGSRSKIVDAWKRAHNGAEPTSGDILGVWASHAKRTTPVPPPVQPEPGLLQRAGKIAGRAGSALIDAASSAASGLNTALTELSGEKQTTFYKERHPSEK